MLTDVLIPRLRLVLVAAVAIALLGQSSALADVGAVGRTPPPTPGVISPTSGPPGTVITVTPGALCPPPGTAQVGFVASGTPLGGGQSIPWLSPPVTVVLPTGTLVAPDLPIGEYSVLVECGGEEGLNFELTGAPGPPEAAPPTGVATPVNTQPRFTG